MPSTYKTKVAILQQLLEEQADCPFCLRDGQTVDFPKDECIKCRAYRFCNEWHARYLVALSRLEKAEVATGV
jgi:hypothetical protein